MWRRRIWIGPALFILLLASLAVSHTEARGQSGGDSTVHLPAVVSDAASSLDSDAIYAPGRIAVGVRRDVVGAAAVETQIQAQVISEIDLAGLDGSDGDAGVDGYLVRTEPGQEWQTIERLLENPAVAFAEPDWIVRAAEVEIESDAAEVPFKVNDPFYKTEQWYLQRIRASRAWALSGKIRAQMEDASTIRVAVIDSGVDSRHKDLKDNLSLQFKNYVDPGQPPIDDCGHGTHITGLIGAGINNRMGIAGTAADILVIPYKTLSLNDLNDCVGFVSNIADAIRHAAGSGDADIINLSLELDEDFTFLKAAVDYARSQGVLVIGAAGNCVGVSCPQPVKYPAAYPAVMAVAATGYYDNRAWYSSTGDELALAAPGGDSAHLMLSTWSSDAVQVCGQGLHVVDGAYYCEDLGTSMSAGVVTGVAALVWSVRPQFSADEVEDILIESAQPLPPYLHWQVGSGLVDADRAVRYALRSRLTVEPRELQFRLPIESPPFETTLLLENPSLEPIAWLITRTSAIDWIETVEPISGTVRYGEPVRVPLVISATHTISGSYRSTFSVEGLREDGGKLVIPIAAALSVYTPTLEPALYLPVMGQSSTGEPVWPYVDFTWETPDTTAPGAIGRIEYALPKNSSIGITLPVTITVGGKQYTDARIYADGHVTLPAIARVERPVSECLPLSEASGLVMFGWWADLDPGRSGGRVSTFQAAPDRFVIEFTNVRVDGGSDYDRVSFQMVLYANGRVGLNYGRMPDYAGAPQAVTVGVQRQDGRFYNQIACATSDIEIGTIPKSYQSILLREGDLY